MLVKPGRRAGQKAERNDHRVGRQNVLGPRDWLRNPSAARIGFAESRLDELYTFNTVRAHNLNGLAVEEKLNSLFLAVLVVAPGAGHVVLIAPVRAGHGLGTLPDRRTIAVHSRVTATQHNHTLAAHADQALRA